MSRWDDDPYYISPEEERALAEREEEERWREEVAAREEQEIEAWLASRPWWWDAWRRWQWRLYGRPHKWLQNRMMAKYRIGAKDSTPPTDKPGRSGAAEASETSS